jgi:metal-dependent amidase/aminoacylase/carboxypeptidase family protein
MAGEDFGYFADRWGGLLFWLGAAGKEYYPLHSGHFLPDEEALYVGVKLFWGLIRARMGT